MNNVSEIKNRKVIMKSTIKTEKTSTCFTRLYGRTAYETWKAREAEITALARIHRYPSREVCRLREDNFRQMKAESARQADEKRSSGNHVRLAA